MNDRKLLNVSAEFNLSKKPGWLDSFRDKYDKPFRYHITLKTSAYFEDKDLAQIKSELTGIISKYTEIPVVFNKLFIGPSSKGLCIMIEAEDNENLINLQKEISNALIKYGEHITDQHKNFEDNFKPHITIGRELTLGKLDEAKRELHEDVHCEALINEVALTTVENDLFEEWNESKNKIYYELHPRENIENRKEINSVLKIK